ncbi:sensor domain-containing diguanylate cyclase [uncultured Shewanella sp.]|uniref:sensor domain-containing diguanylate cyclase n=1 Tax=uncultured Shewanella sp. TaxID=173975 RepID=UPI00263187E1|nr:sensor domain-containing diguanylate cyclase [uncultured Shewanella sp.]
MTLINLIKSVLLKISMPQINIDSSYGVIIIQDMNAVHVDEIYAKIFGYESPESLLSHIDSFLDLLPVDIHKLATQNYHDIVAGKMYPRGHTFTNIDRNGREFTVFSVDHLIQWHGKPALQVTVIDLSVLVEANERIREQDLMFKRLITDSGQGIMVHRNFKPLMINDACVKLLRANSSEQVMGIDSVLKLIPHQYQVLAKQHYQEIICGNTVGSTSVVENICFDGSTRFFNIYDNLIEWDGEPAVQVVIEDVTDKVQLEKELAYKATHDELTDIFNRSAIYDWLDKHLGNSADLTCFLLDIDDFKLVNDTYGHHSGDKVIKALADIIKAVIEDNQGAVGRWGGEEFIGFIPTLDMQLVLELAETIRASFERLEFKSEERAFNVTVSIGISEAKQCHDMKRIESLIKAADKCLYLAKSDGKNTVYISDLAAI